MGGRAGRPAAGRIRIADVTDDAAGRDDFHAVVGSLYRDEPAGTAPDRVAIERNLNRKAFESRQRLFVGYDGDVPAARLAARLSPSLTGAGGAPIGLLGFFEARNHPELVEALFSNAIAWLRDGGGTRGAERVIGPMDGDTWHRYRVNVGPFERIPFPLEPWNPPYYGQLWSAAGFREIESYSSKWIDDVSALLPGLQAGAERARSHGIRIRALDASNIAGDLAIVHAISTEIFRDAVLYSPIERDEFLALYSGVQRFLDPRLVLFAEAPDGAPVGFIFAYADPRRPAAHYKTIGVLAEWRRAAVAAALSDAVYRGALAMGLPQGNHALMRDDNRSQALDQGLGEVFRRYALYEWSDP